MAGAVVVPDGTLSAIGKGGVNPDTTNPLVFRCGILIVTPIPRCLLAQFMLYILQKFMLYILQKASPAVSMFS